MKELEKSKQCYDQIEIPEELNERVLQAIAGAKQNTTQRKKAKAKEKRFKVVKSKRSRFFSYVSTAAAAVLVCITLGLNTNETFAKEMGKMPVFGKLARVLTVRSFHGVDEKNGMEIDVDVPQVALDTQTDEAAVPETASLEADASTQDQASLVSDVNAQIEEIVESHMEKSKKDFAEYKEAFFATGGTQEEWADRTMDVNIHYDVKYQDEDILSLVLYVSEAWVAAYEEQHYYNLNLKENRSLTLKDLLGEDYVAIANQSILSQMQERMEEDENYVYWGISEEDKELGIEGFTTVDDNTTFYINENGNPVVTFEKYSIAPGFMGVQEFEIPVNR